MFYVSFAIPAPITRGCTQRHIYPTTFGTDRLQFLKLICDYMHIFVLSSALPLLKYIFLGRVSFVSKYRSIVLNTGNSDECFMQFNDLKI